MTQDDLIVFIKLYTSECIKMLEESKEFRKNIEEQSPVTKKAKSSLELSLEDQINSILKDKEDLVIKNNQLNVKVTTLLKELEAHKEVINKLKSDNDSRAKIIEELKADAEENENTIAEYEKDFDEYDKDAQEAENKITKMTEEINIMTVKVKTLEQSMQKLKKEVDETRQENEILALGKISDINIFKQETLQLTKSITIAEKSISHLTKEKIQFSSKIEYLETQLTKSTKKRLDKEVQTDEYKENELEESNKLHENLLKEQEEFNKINNYTTSLIEEINKLKEKNTKIQLRNCEIENIMNERNYTLDILKKDKEILIQENTELKKRREHSNAEITMLRKQIIRDKSKSKMSGIGRSTSATTV